MPAKRKTTARARPVDAGQRILRAADEILGEVGFEGMSIADVAARAGVNKALVFYYFENKAALLAKILDGYYAAHVAALEGAFAVEGSLRERLHRLIDGYVAFIAHNRRFPRLIQQLVAGSGAHADLIERSLAPLADWTMRALAEVTPKTGPLAARHFFVTFSGIVINYFTYAPVLGGMWRGDPAASPALEERLAHLHWMVDTLLDGLEREHGNKRRELASPAS